jgi:hypothetical protein
VGDSVGARGDSVDAQLVCGVGLEVVDPVCGRLVADSGKPEERRADVDEGERGGVPGRGRARKFKVEGKGDERPMADPRPWPTISTRLTGSTDS